MSWPLLVVCLVALLCAPLSVQSSPTIEAQAKNGGVPCVGCTLIVSLIRDISIENEKAIEDVVSEICNFFPPPSDALCHDFMSTAGPIIIHMLLKGLSPDYICQQLTFCTSTTCRLWPIKDADLEKEQQLQPFFAQQLKEKMKETPWEWLLRMIAVLTEKHEPLVDFDGDKFGYWTRALRGSYWRGADCNDYDSSIYPGRKSTASHTSYDHNCNGIHGKDNQGRPWEEVLCSGTGMQGVAILGDSAAAHFHIPEEYMDASQINPNTYTNIINFFENEFDWPHLSWATAYQNTTWLECPGPADSIYHRLWQRNHCNFRDFQNIGVNGARTGSMLKIEKSLNRNQTTDHPILLFYALIGNDVCSPRHSLDAMTKPEQFYKNVMESMTYLDNTLPAGSHVVFIGLVDGRILWDTMSKLIHPIGTTYANVYDFLNCVEANPCWVWLNSNETIRNLGTARANELNQVYDKIVSNSTFKNFDTFHIPFPLPQIIEKWTKQGGEVRDLIEPIDGFHPSQLANFVGSQVIWEILEKEKPEFLGPVNPNNAKIRQLFGDQGGY